MSKRSRFIIILVVLAVCFAFLWPSISWYALTSKDEKALALGSLEKIKDYSAVVAREYVNELKSVANKSPDEILPKTYAKLEKVAKKNYKALGKKCPKSLTAQVVLDSFSGEDELLRFAEGIIREKILLNKKRYTNSVKLGLDLSGGMNIIVRADLDEAIRMQNESSEVLDVNNFKAEAMAQAIETLSGRIDKFGLSSPVIRQQGEDRIYIEIPGAADSSAVNTIIMGKGILNFRLVDNVASENFNRYYFENPTETFDSQGNLRNSSIIPADCEVLGLYAKDDYGLDERRGFLVVKKQIALDGKHVKSAEVRADSITNRPEVNFVLDAEGAEIFAEFTGSHIGESLAIVSDDKIKSYANIREAIPGGQVQISGFSLEEAQNLQKVLQTAWLSVPLEVESRQVIGASLGQQAIQQGLRALLVGLLAVLVFMLIYYTGAGVNAVVAQILNMYMMFSILSAFNLTLTLSSIAGMILTVGMSVDANVIIFERIKEELRSGKTRQAAISTGFDNAFWAIMDSNITTFIAAIFLSQLGTGAVQGFAISLAIGVVSSVFTALIVSRLMFDFNTDVLKKTKVSIGYRGSKK